MTQFLRYTSIALIFLTTFIPLYVNNALFFPFITGKGFAFRIIVEILFAIWLLLVLRDKKYAPKYSHISALVTGFVFVILIADLFGLNPVRSIWSNFERMEGWVTIIHLWAYFIVTTSVFGSGEEGRRMWHNFFRMSLFSAFIVGIYGLVQYFGGAEIHQGSSRIDASLGNAAYMAVYMLGHIFLAFYLGLVEWSKRNSFLVWMYTVLGLFFSFLLYETSTRGTILGLVGGLLLALGIYAFFGNFNGEEEPSRLRWWSIGIIVVIILSAVTLVANKNSAWVLRSPVLTRLATISWNENKTQARGYIWPMAVKGVFDNPKTAIIGVGQENFNYIFNANYNPKMWNQEQWFDRAHNVFLDWLVAGGILGFLLYVSLFVASLMALWKSNLTFAEKSLLTGLFVGYGIHNIFVFDNIASYMLFFTFLGFVHSVTAEKPIKLLEISDEQTENKVVVRDYIYFPVIVIVFFAVLYFVNIKPIQANTKLITALSYCQGGKPTAELYADALKYHAPTADQEIREQLLSCATGVVPAQQFSVETKKAFYDLALREIDNQAKATPNDARTFTLAGVFLNNVGDWANGQKVLERAAELTPDKQSTLFELATNYLNTGKAKEAVEITKRSYESAIENENAKLAYVTALVLNGEEKKARELFGSTPEIFTTPQMVGVYAQRKEFTKIIDIYKNLIIKEPNNIQYYGSLARAYLENGQKSLAIAELEIMKTKFPEAKADIEAAIKQINGETPSTPAIQLQTE